MNINSVARLLANVISLENIKTQQHIIQRNDGGVNEILITKLLGVLK